VGTRSLMSAEGTFCTIQIRGNIQQVRPRQERRTLLERRTGNDSRKQEYRRSSRFASFVHESVRRGTQSVSLRRVVRGIFRVVLLVPFDLARRRCCDQGRYAHYIRRSFNPLFLGKNDTQVTATTGLYLLPNCREGEEALENSMVWIVEVEQGPQVRQTLLSVTQDDPCFPSAKTLYHIP
jgi:hypothetical protein